MRIDPKFNISKTKKTEQKTNKKQISMQATLLQYNSPTCDIYYKQPTQLR